MQPTQPIYRRFVFVFVFVLLVSLASISLLSHGALAETSVGKITTHLFMPLITNIPTIGGSVPH
ncbi:MAG: hypothetical protein NT075_09475 [Chloroflexi bacterium]|nr:hypothetical protein [Chloroflexota bacterium]